DQVADRARLTKQDASRAIDALLATVEDALRRGSEVSVSGFGKFHVSDRGARTGVNPRTGERIQIAASRVPRFSAGSALKNAVKLQLARFEALGETGRSVLGAVATHARSLGLLVIADGKRGDIEVSSRAYASALFDGLQTPFGTLDGLHADLATVNPLLGRDALEPFVSAARTRGAGVLALVRTSNEGAAEIQDLRLEGGGAVR